MRRYQKSLIVIEDFYSDPIAVRELGLNCTYSEPNADQAFAGVESKAAYFTQTLISTLEQIVGNTIVVDPAKNAFGRFRKRMSASLGRTSVHFDDTDWTGIVYLFDDPGAGGTTLYKHLGTGLFGPPDETTVERLGYTSLAEFDQSVVMRDTLDLSKWSASITVAARFNRLVLVRGGENFHGASEFQAASHREVRLTQVFFFDDSA
ncbi:DUF6445 family protein [Bradyrhizobium sp. AZCC 1699]|uniref:DUF6445 family protein n=1 Tax=Bradyrhizobium sp. AZCC 1699 TaxID=3117024 RepID=UPI002FEEEEC0